MYLVKTNRNFLFEILAILIIFCFLLPTFKIGSTTSIKLDWVFVKFIFLILLLFYERLIKIKIYKKYIITFLCIAICTLISNYFTGAFFLKGSNIRLPTDIIMIFDRVTVFIFFSYSVYRGFISYELLKKIIILVFTVALLFGLFQFFDLFGVRDLSEKFYLDVDSVQGQNFTQFNRIIGVAPAIITWGGVTVLIFYFFYFLVSNFLFRYVGIILAIFNVLASASRAAIVSLVGSFLIIMLIKVVVIDKKMISFLKIIFSIIFLFSLSFYLLNEFAPEQIVFLEKRFERSNEAFTNEGRGLQLLHFWNIYKNEFYAALFGVGPSVIYEYGYLEVDFAYVFFGYGIIGFIFHYLLIYYLLKETYKYRFLKPKLFLFTWGSTIGYLIFSVGFYFFYELYMGMPYWWLNGMVLGVIWLEAKSNKYV